jgi:hypothetical protein
VTPLLAVLLIWLFGLPGALVLWEWVTKGRVAMTLPFVKVWTRKHLARQLDAWEQEWARLTIKERETRGCTCGVWQRTDSHEWEWLAEKLIP